jgi:Ni/Co efflux regulator RcnB
MSQGRASTPAVWSAVVCVVAVWLMAAATVLAQEQRTGRQQRDRQDHAQFDDHDRQVTHDWYEQHRNHPPRGLRPQDRLSPEQERRLAPGRPVDRDLRKREHSLPSDLARKLPPPPAHHRYVAIGGHVGLIDQVTHVLRDVIHVHGG